MARRPKSPWRVRNLICGALALILVTGLCQAQEETTGQEDAKTPHLNVDFTLGWGGCYRPMVWTPVEVSVTCNMKNPVEAKLVISAQQDSLSVLSVSHPIVLQKDHNLTVPLVTKLAPGASTCDASISDKGGHSMWSREYALQNYGGGAQNQALGANDALVGLVGRRESGLAQLGTTTLCRTSEGHQGGVKVKDKLQQYLPWDWTGYVSLDLLILSDPDWDKINVNQAQAIAQWVSNGGSLLIVLGSRPLPAGHPLAAMLPLTLGQPHKIGVRAGEIPFSTGSARVIRSPRGPARGPAPAAAPAADGNTITAWELADLRDTSWTVERFGVEPVLATGAVGFGHAGVLLFDPADLKGVLDTPTDRLWVWAFKNLTGARKVELGQPPDPENNSGYSNRGYGGQNPLASAQTSAATNKVLEHLLQIPELRPLSIWWVIGLLTLLALLLGPVDYLVLKKLDRLPMTWVTSSVIIALFTAGAYYGVQALRAGSTQVRSVTVTDGIAGGPAWSTSYSGIFASSSDDYPLEGLAGNQWWSGIAPTRGEYEYYRGDEDLATRRIYCRQLDGGNLPYSLPISIWSMQCLVAEWPVAQMPFSADVTVNGKEVTVDIDNKSASAIRNVWVEIGDRMADLDGVPAKSKTSLRSDSLGARDRAVPPQYRFSPGTASAVGNAVQSQGTQQRTTAVESYLRNRAAVVYAIYEDAPCVCQVSDARKNTNHVQLVRLVVFPKRAEGQ